METLQLMTERLCEQGVLSQTGLIGTRTKVHTLKHTYSFLYLSVDISLT